MQEFCLFASARTGSTLLVSLLGGSPDILCHGEIFHNKRLNLPPDLLAELPGLTVEERQRDPLGFLERLNAAESRRHPDRRLLGFKVFAAHADHLWRKLLAEPSRPKVHVFRRNRLAQYSSLLIAKETGAWSTKAAARETETPKLAFDAAHFEQWLGHQQRYDAHFEGGAAGTPVFAIEYREITDPARQAALFAFLGAAPPPAPAADAAAPAGTQKQHGPEIAARFANPKAVHECLRRIGHPEWKAE